MPARFELYYDGKDWCARGIGEDIFTQATSIPELLENMREATEIHSGHMPQRTVFALLVPVGQAHRAGFVRTPPTITTSYR